MLGKYRIQVSDKRISYDFEVKQKITIIHDLSATGKTTFYNLITLYNQNSLDINLTCDVPIRALPLDKRSIELELDNCINRGITNVIYVIDEFNIDKSDKFKLSRYLCSKINQIDCYFIIIGREFPKNLSYDMFEIYRIQYNNGINTLVNLYNDEHNNLIKPDLVITEDSNTGFDFFNSLFSQFSIECLSSFGKDNIVNAVESRLLASKYNCIYVIVDASAFGSVIKKYIDLLYEYESLNTKVYLGVPKSFEFLLLHIKDLGLNQDIFNKYYNYCDLSKHKETFLSTQAVYNDFISLERFYTQYLVDITRNTCYNYPKNKGKLPNIYLDKKYFREVIECLNDLDLEVL